MTEVADGAARSSGSTSRPRATWRRPQCYLKVVVKKLLPKAHVTKSTHPSSQRVCYKHLTQLSNSHRSYSGSKI
eukprot:scaffold93420_cov59-Phaeocystis_antarctica.AAC.6